MIWGLVLVGCLAWAISDARARRRRRVLSARRVEIMLQQTPAPLGYKPCPICYQIVAAHTPGETIVTWKFVEVARNNHAALHVVSVPSMN